MRATPGKLVRHEMRTGAGTWLLAAALLLIAARPGAPQEGKRVYAGALAGVSTLSADGRSVAGPTDAALSLYKPENGLALNVFAGRHLSDYFSVQANYIWNRNELTLTSSFLTPNAGGFYEQRRRSAQHALVADGLVYFRRRSSTIRPYLGTGLAVVRFTSRDIISAVSSHFMLPPGDIVTTSVALRSHVGIDVALSGGLVFRYSFSETIGKNPVSRRLTPPGERGLANFQNLFGIAARF